LTFCQRTRDRERILEREREREKKTIDRSRSDDLAAAAHTPNDANRIEKDGKTRARALRQTENKYNARFYILKERIAV